MRSIRILWPTVRPLRMKANHSIWMSNTSGQYDISTEIAVNTREQRRRVSEFPKVFVIGTEKPGPAYATYVLSQQVEAEDKDIIILSSDDFYSSPGWDKWLIEKAFHNWEGAIFVYDGHQPGGCITIPIMTYSCLLKLNRIIYHPSYTWQFCDAELQRNLAEMKLLRNISRERSLRFEHRHWANNKRKVDNHDKVGLKAYARDKKNFNRRMKMDLDERLKSEAL